MHRAIPLDSLSLEEKISRINAYQELGAFRPLTCRKDSQHPNLVPKAHEGQLVLICEEPGCGYRQTDVPRWSYHKSVAELKEYTEQFRNRVPSEPPENS